MTTSNLVKVQELLGDRVGRDVTMISISLDPEHDTPEVLAEYAELYETGPGWVFLTGDYDETEDLRHKIGVWDIDPVLDQDRSQHAALLVYGDAPRDRWAFAPGIWRPEQIERAVRRLFDI